MSDKLLVLSLTIRTVRTRPSPSHRRSPTVEQLEAKVLELEGQTHMHDPPVQAEVFVPYGKLTVIFKRR